MNTYKTNGCRSVSADSHADAAHIFARRMARRKYGKRGMIGAIRQSCYSPDGGVTEWSAFIGKPQGNTVDGGNVHFTVFLNTNH